MNRIIAAIILLCIISAANGQTISAAETVKNYSVSQKRLLVINTAQFINFLTQDNLDQDSVMAIASDITGMPFLLPYNETFPESRVSAVTGLVNAGRLNEAKRAVNTISGEMRIQGLLEISLWYLHQNGSQEDDLDSASRFIELALSLCTADNFNGWKKECHILSAELQYQKGNIKQSGLLFQQLTETGHGAGKDQITALAYMRMGDLLLSTDSAKEDLYNRALNIYASLGLKERQIELLFKIAGCHELRDFALMEKDLHDVLQLQSKTGFKHNLYAQYILSFIFVNREDYLGAVGCARAALENMKWSGFSDVEGAFYIRMADACGSLGKMDEELQWFNKALLVGTKKTHLFWYKSLLYLTGVLCLDLKKPAEALYLVDSVTAIFPPITLWEQMQVISTVGLCYELLKKPVQADKYYMQLLELNSSNPLADPYGEISDTYIDIARFYVFQHNLARARLFLKQGLVKDRKNASSLCRKYSLYYQIDSLEGNYKLALQNHIKFKLYYDSATGMDQRKKMDELTIKYAAEKKDQDIKLLKQQGVVQQTELNQNKLTRNIMVAGTILLLIIVGLLFSQFKLKQRTNAAMNKKNLALQHLVSEKEWLLKEVHHRVKNNLHTVISLLESQAAYLENDALKAIENSQHRIYAMSLIHQKLYQAEDVKTIDMSVYLPEFIRYIDESFDTHYRIQFKLEIDAINLGVSQAIPIALIINESVTNSIKYAFPQNRKGIIEISMRKNADQITLIIADNGIGIDESLLNAPSESLGLKLIKGLSADINASINIKNDSGTRITIVFNVDPFYNNKLMPEINEKEILRELENI